MYVCWTIRILLWSESLYRPTLEVQFNLFVTYGNRHKIQTIQYINLWVTWHIVQSTEQCYMMLDISE